mgnify:CR=1 FL=1
MLFNFALLTVMSGLSIIFKDTIGNKVRKEIKKINNKDTQEYGAIFGGQDLDFTKEKFGFLFSGFLFF